VIPSSRSAVPLRGLAVAVAAVLIPAIAGCEAGANAPVLRWHRPTPGAQAVVNDTIRINNVFVLGPSPGSSLPSGTSAGVFMALANEGAPDRLVSISAPGAAQAVTLPGGSVRLGRLQSVLLTGPLPHVVLQGLTRPLSGGQAVRLVLTFANAGSVTMNVPVMPRAQYYATYSPVPSPSPSPSATHAKHKRKAGTSPATPAPSAT
jgi:copper(I)-binding protein